MGEADIGEAARIVRVAFGTHIGAPDPEAFGLDRDYIGTRFRNPSVAALVAEIDGQIAGSNVATRWGGFGFFGPLTVRPDLWNSGVGQKLLSATMEIFSEWGVRDAGLFTFANSPKHAALYQKYGFWPRFLTAIMAKQVNGAGGRKGPSEAGYFSRAESEITLAECREVTDLIHEGLDVSCEIRAARDQRLGETLLVYDRATGRRVEGFAVCHCGEGTEAGKEICYVKFAAVRPSDHAAAVFTDLLDACEALAASRGLKRLEAGVSTAAIEAYRAMFDAGFRTAMQGVAMHRNNAPGWNRPGYFVLGDWR